MKWSRLLLLIFVLVGISHGENYLINGGQESQINYQMVQKVVPAPGTQRLVLSFVMPESYSSPTFKQKVTNFSLKFSANPNSKEESSDANGNKIVKVTWNNPTGMITSAITLSSLNQTILNPLQTRAPFPLTQIPSEAQRYLGSTQQVTSDNPQIIRLAKELTANSKTEFDAIQKILSWVVDHMTYVLTPQSYEALYSLQSGRGNCQNYSHLAGALMRAVGIPVRIVNGVTLKTPYEVETNLGTMTLRMAQGRHSWIEVYFPDLGWVPFDPQQTALYVSNRFIRVEVGVDNEDTSNDGLIRWVQQTGRKGQPQFEEVIDAAFVADNVRLNAMKQNYGPKKLLFVPQVEASFTKIAAPPPPPPPQIVAQERLKALTFEKTLVFGNLEFPENVDFLSSRGPAQTTRDGAQEMRKNFLVETAEYVTTQGNQYAQTFILQSPLKLEKVGLALHKFGGDGQLWIDLFKDDGKGRPGEIISTSEFLNLNQIKGSMGYSWVDFGFAKESPLLSPGRYWIALGFTGSPVINWFFSYGKPVGPEDGTRYKTLFDETWSRSLAFEFNYRVVGLGVE